MKKDRKTKNSIWNKFRMALGCHLEDRMIEAGRKNRQKALSELTNEIAKAYPELSVTQYFSFAMRSVVHAAESVDIAAEELIQAKQCLKRRSTVLTAVAIGLSLLSIALSVPRQPKRYDYAEP